MRISTLRIENYRSIRSLKLDVPAVCALVGPNNAGKSNLLGALRSVLARDWAPRATDFSEDDVFNCDPDLDIEITVRFDEEIPYRKLKDADPAKVAGLRFKFDRYKRGPQAGERRLDQSLLNANEETIKSIQATYPAKGKPPRFDALYTIPHEVREQVPVIYIGADRKLQDQLPTARHSLLRRMFEEIDRKLHEVGDEIIGKAEDGTEIKINRVAEFQKIMQEAVNLLRTRDFDELETAIKRNAMEQLGLNPATDALNLSFTPLSTMDFYKSLALVVREGNFSISAARMGHGMQNAIVMAILRAFEETHKRGAIILIEEPEICLHPTMQRSLFATLRRIGETNQVIYTTHSPHFVSVPDYRDVVLVRRDAEEGTNVTRSQLDAGNRRVEKLRQAVDRERGELFFARRLLLVEGDTEKLAMPEHARKLNLDLDTRGAAIVEVGGKRNLMDFATLSVSFGIPTGVVYDRDSSDFDDKEAEAQHNAELDAFDNGDTVRVWQFDKDYETLLRREIGNELYTKMLEKYPKAEFGAGKPRRQRMIAADGEVPVPSPIEEILYWLVG